MASSEATRQRATRFQTLRCSAAADLVTSCCELGQAPSPSSTAHGRPCTPASILCATRKVATATPFSRFKLRGGAVTVSFIYLLCTYAVTPIISPALSLPAPRRGHVSGSSAPRPARRRLVLLDRFNAVETRLRRLLAFHVQRLRRPSSSTRGGSNVLPRPALTVPRRKNLLGVASRGKGRPRRRVALTNECVPKRRL